MMTFDGDMVIVAGLDDDDDTVLVPDKVRATIVTILAPPGAGAIRCGDFANDTGIIVIFVGVFMGESAILLIECPDFVGVTGKEVMIFAGEVPVPVTMPD